MKKEILERSLINCMRGLAGKYYLYREREEHKREIIYRREIYNSFKSKIREDELKWASRA